MEVKTFIDESGTIPKELSENHRFFIVSLIHTDDHKKLNKRFSRSLQKAIKGNPTLIEELKLMKEIKGSHMDEAIKTKIYSDLARLYTNENGDVEGIEIGIITTDVEKLVDRLRQNKVVCFNYLLELYFITFSRRSRLYNKDMELELLIDNQNVATKNLRGLEPYLNAELGFKKNLFSNDIVADYYDSKCIRLIQLADLIANTVFRHIQGDPLASYNLKILEPLFMGNIIFKFPL